MSQIFWRQTADAVHDAPCLFLDRDGVLVRELGYLHRRNEVEVLDGAAELIDAARRRGFAVGIITNQAGIGRGYYGWAEFMEVQEELASQLDGAAFDFVAACAAHPDAAVPEQRISAHPWRKPAAGMILMAASALRLDLSASVLIGDQASDVRAALAAGIGHIAHVLTGHGARERDAVRDLESAASEVLLVRDLRGVVTRLGW